MTTRVRALINVMGIRRGEEADVDDELAICWVEAGLVDVVEEAPPLPSPRTAEDKERSRELLRESAQGRDDGGPGLGGWDA